MSKIHPGKSIKYRGLRKIIKIIKISFFVSVIGFLLLLSIIYAYLTSRWRNAFTEEQMMELAEEVNNSDELPAKFLFIYDKMYPGRRHTGLYKELIYAFIDEFVCKIENRYNSPYRRLYNSLLDRRYAESIQGKIGHQPSYFFSWGIKNYCSPEKAFDYYIHDYLSFLRNYDQLPNCQKKIIYSNLESLSLDELIECVLILENYCCNKEKYQESFYKEKRYFLRKILEKD